MVEPVHSTSATPISIDAAPYQLRSGHAWVGVCSQKSVLDAFVKPFAPDR